MLRRTSLSRAFPYPLVSGQSFAQTIPFRLTVTHPLITDHAAIPPDPAPIRHHLLSHPPPATAGVRRQQRSPTTRHLVVTKNALCGGVE